jgi:transposase
MRGTRLKHRTAADVDGRRPAPELALAVKRNLAVRRCLETPMATMAQTVTQRVKLQAECKDLRTVRGMGQILALTMMLETGDSRRFPTVGNCASSCRCVGSEKRSQGKRKGSGNTKNGNQYLAWAFREAAHFAVRYHPCIKRFSQRQQAKTNTVVATKAVAHQWARACFYLLRDQVPVEVSKACQ